jgi:hypothetical protein
MFLPYIHESQQLGANAAAAILVTVAIIPVTKVHGFLTNLPTTSIISEPAFVPSTPSAIQHLE